MAWEGAMHTYDPKVLRRLAATYRKRATTEPDKANLFLEIARDMEFHADRIEGDPKLDDG
jgi:hypothetical protein